MDQLFANVPPNLQSHLAHPSSSWNAILDPDEFKDDVPDLPPATSKDDKLIRRRSSKACDQCRKSKCKCERSGPQHDSCKNCVLLGTPCTFLGPSRKRGPPKGYIDAIESRLHQLEALLGALLSANDHRARSLLDDLAGDPLARDILERVDTSPFGSRPKQPPLDVLDDRASRVVRTVPRTTRPLTFTSPSAEWQEHLKERLRVGAHNLPRLHTDVRRPSDGDGDGCESPHQRRRLDSASPPLQLHVLPGAARSSSSHSRSRSPSPVSSSDEELASAVGQLSLNEDSQVRYHGKVSGLHILGQSDRLDKRNEGGIWRFPKAGVWPRALNSADRARDDLESAERDARASFPCPNVQQELLELYFVYVHPVLPLMQEAQFWRDFRGESEPSPPHAPNAGKSRVPTLLLLSMFAIAARYCSTPDVPLPAAEGDMWGAGDEYLEHAKRILNQTYASSRPSTCQALLLLSYREVGVGAMAQAWLYVGMAVRMAQDLGMHRSAEKWQRTGAQLFTESERQLRKRIWYACVVMDKYVSTYIGRPLSIFERDFDTPYPSEDLAEENVLWEHHRTACPVDSATDLHADQPPSYIPAPMHIISCFNGSARLSSILSSIVEMIYAVQISPTHSRHADAAALEKRLDKWYLDLPPHLQLGPTNVPPPHVFTLHMQYWCTVLLLHRPFMRRKLHNTHNGQTAQEAEAEATASCRKAFDLCAMAATKITNIVSKYKETFCLQRSPAFFTYYVFSASIMHITTLSVRPTDIQAGMGLHRCMDALQKMQMVWPSAERAWELVHGAKIDMHAVEMSRQQHDKRKRDVLQERAPRFAEAAVSMDEGPSATITAGTWSDSVREYFGYAPGFTDLPGDVLLFSQLAGADAASGSGGFMPKTDHTWKGFPEGFVGGDPALVTSSLYGLPVLSAPMNNMQGAPPFMGNGFQLYSDIVPTNRDPVSSDGAF